jgi:hypothetical protein
MISKKNCARQSEGYLSVACHNKKNLQHRIEMEQKNTRLHFVVTRGVTLISAPIVKNGTVVGTIGMKRGVDEHLKIA